MLADKYTMYLLKHVSENTVDLNPANMIWVEVTCIHGNAELVVRRQMCMTALIKSDAH